MIRSINKITHLKKIHTLKFRRHVSDTSSVSECLQVRKTEYTKGNRKFTILEKRSQSQTICEKDYRIPEAGNNK